MTKRCLAPLLTIQIIVKLKASIVLKQILTAISGQTQVTRTSSYSLARGTYNKIANNREERYISGLQYAVERAAELNKDITDKKDRVVVWVGAGIYTDYKGFVVRDKVEVIGGFPYEGYPEEDDRHPLLSQYVPARKEYETLDKT